jgi:hypothetical protein
MNHNAVYLLHPLSTYPAQTRFVGRAKLAGAVVEGDFSSNFM